MSGEAKRAICLHPIRYVYIGERLPFPRLERGSPALPSAEEKAQRRNSITSRGQPPGGALAGGRRQIPWRERERLRIPYRLPIERGKARSRTSGPAPALLVCRFPQRRPLAGVIRPERQLRHQQASLARPPLLSHLIVKERTQITPQQKSTSVRWKDMPFQFFFLFLPRRGVAGEGRALAYAEYVRTSLEVGALPPS